LTLETSLLKLKMGYECDNLEQMIPEVSSRVQMSDNSNNLLEQNKIKNWEFNLESHLVKTLESENQKVEKNPLKNKILDENGPV